MFPVTTSKLFTFFEIDGAEDQSRTDDLLITNQLLYQLSYFGLHLRLYR